MLLAGIDRDTEKGSGNTSGVRVLHFVHEKCHSAIANLLVCLASNQKAMQGEIKSIDRLCSDINGAFLELVRRAAVS